MAIDPPTAEVEGKSKRRVGCTTTTTTTCFKEIRFLAQLAVYNNTYIVYRLGVYYVYILVLLYYMYVFDDFSIIFTHTPPFSQDDTAEQILKK